MGVYIYVCMCVYVCTYHDINIQLWPNSQLESTVTAQVAVILMGSKGFIWDDDDVYGITTTYVCGILTVIYVW